MQTYYRKHREARLAYLKLWQERNRARRLKWQRDYGAGRKGLKRDYDQFYYQKHKQKRLVQKADWYDANQASVKGKARLYRKATR